MAIAVTCLTHFNIFEKMFHPYDAPEFETPAPAQVNGRDMVLAGRCLKEIAMPGAIEFVEVSLLSSSQLNARQTSSFNLATLSFEGIGSGNASFSFETGVVDDALGNKLVVVPLPEVTRTVSRILRQVTIGLAPLLMAAAMIATIPQDYSCDFFLMGGIW